MTERTEFWWITSTVWGLPDPTPARVTFDGAHASRVHAFGTDEFYHPRDVRLIERVLPAGCATAAALHSALVSSSWHGSGYVSRLQGCEETDDAGETVGHTTLIDGYFDLQRAAEILAAGGGTA